MYKLILANINMQIIKQYLKLEQEHQEKNYIYYRRMIQNIFKIYRKKKI